MTSRIQTQRFATPNTRPSSGVRPSGELWLNLPDFRLGMIDSVKAPVDLLPTRVYASTASYAVGDHVVYLGLLQRAKVAISPGAYDATQWDPIQSQSFNDARYTTQTLSDARYLRLAGGTLTGPLVLAADPTINLGAVTRQYVDTGHNAVLAIANAAVPKAGGTMTGLLTLSGDPSAALGAATRQYVDGTISRAGGPFLPLTGGIVSGPVTVNSSFGATSVAAVSGFYANSFNGYEWAFAVDSGGSKIQNYRSGWYDIWSGSTGSRSWYAPGGLLMNLTGAGALSCTGNLGTGGNLSVVGGIVEINADPNFILAKIGGRPSLYFASGIQINWDGINTNYNTSGTHVFSGQISGSSNIIANAGSFFGHSYNPNFYCTADATYDYMVFSTDLWRFQYHRDGNGWDWVRSDNLILAHLDGNGNWFTYGGQNAFASDERTKQNVQPYTRGLADLVQLEPVTFQFNGAGGTPNDGVTHTGLIAQAAQPFIPECVYEMPEPAYHLRPGDPTPEPVRLPGQLAINDEALLYAVINSLKELDTRVRALEAP